MRAYILFTFFTTHENGWYSGDSLESIGRMLFGPSEDIRILESLDPSDPHPFAYYRYNPGSGTSTLLGSVCRIEDDGDVHRAAGSGLRGRSGPKAPTSAGGGVTSGPFERVDPELWSIAEEFADIMFDIDPWQAAEEYDAYYGDVPDDLNDLPPYLTRMYYDTLLDSEIPEVIDIVRNDHIPSWSLEFRDRFEHVIERLEDVQRRRSSSGTGRSVSKASARRPVSKASKPKAKAPAKKPASKPKAKAHSKKPASKPKSKGAGR